MRIELKALSVNQAWQGKRFKTPTYKKFERDLMMMLLPLKIEDNRFLQLNVTFGYSSKLADFDNGLKPFIDVLQKKYNFNDNRIKRAIINIDNDVAKGDEYIDFEIFYL